MSTLPYSAQAHGQGFHGPETALDKKCDTNQFGISVRDVNLTRALKCLENRHCAILCICGRSSHRSEGQE